TDAEAACRRAIALRPSYPDAHNNLGNLLKDTNRLPEAELAYRYALELNPHYADAYNNLGTLLKETDRFSEAEAVYSRALQLKPDYVHAHINLGTLFKETERLSEAEMAYRYAIALNPESVDAYNNLGNLLQETNRLAEAESAYRHTIAIKPDFPQAYNNLGNLLRNSNRLPEAEAAYRHALELNPQYADAHNNLGIALKDSGQFEAALASCCRALEIAPDNPEAHLNYAFQLLQAGELTQGWQEYEYRWKLKRNKSWRDFVQPLWLGDVGVVGKTIFLHAEQGFGDTLQFVRYASLLAARGAIVYLGVPPALKTLAATCSGVATVFTSGDALPPFDYHCPLMSLPLAFHTDLETIPCEVPYLTAPPCGIAAWQEKLGDKTAMRVGLVWAGNPRKHLPSVHAVDRQRSIAFDQLSSLLEVPGIQFFSLQLGDEAASQLNRYPQVIDFTTEIQDFQDTAALIANLDLVIGVDTAVAHLAGAIGKPVWMLNRYNTCWRWLMEREDSPWYPSMRIFRQSSLGDWVSVIANVKRALEEKVKSRV
ncbi:MAG TPA: tetratricopeptide repeat protein, partial [Burkholderiaceae bacterium]|nr:tetratricopeptide repeat protein [Burkholderiaceae bacterium]